MTDQSLSAFNLVDFNWVTSLDNVWMEDVPAIPGHNQQEYNAIYQQIQALAYNPQSGPSLGRIVIGQGGSGKTHLARMLCDRVLGEGCHFVFVDCTDIRDFWETVLLGYIKSLLRHHRGETQIKRLLSFLFTDVAGSNVPNGFFERMDDAPVNVLQIYTETLLSNEKVKRKLAQAPSPDLPIRQIIRALCFLHSSDENIHDLGYSWLLGQGLETAEATDLKLSGVRGASYTHARIVKGLSWLMAQRAPTLLVLDQLDPIIAQYHFATAITEGPDDEQLRAKVIIEGLGGGLSKLYDNTSRTVSTVFLLKESWDKLQVTTLSSNLDRFEPPMGLKVLTSQASVVNLLLGRLKPAYKLVGFIPPYPTYPFPESELAALSGRFPRQVLQEFNLHRQRCLGEGRICEYKSDPGASIGQPVALDFSKIVADKAAQADVAKLLSEEREDELGDRLASLCEGLVHELANQSGLTFTCEHDFKGGSYPSLHARLRRIEHGANEREEHWCLRALEKSNHSAFRARLGAALTEAGIDQGLRFRRLVLIRNNATLPGGQKTKEIHGKFVKAGGKICPLSADELRIIEAVRILLKEKPLGFTAWLAQEKPLSKLAVVKTAFIGIFPEKVAVVTAPSNEKPPASPSPGPLSPTVETPVQVAPASSTLSQVTLPPPAKVIGASNLPLGRRILGSTIQEEITLSAAALTKHVVIRAGSGGGKTVLVKRLIEEAALLGISSIVLDPGNDLAWLGNPWPVPPAGWQEGDAEKAGKYIDGVEVVIWTPGKTQGRPLNLPVLPNLKDVADDRDSLNDAVALAQGSLVPLCANGKSISATRKQGVLTAALKAFGKMGGNLEAFIDFLSDLPPEGTGNITNGAKYGADMADSLRAAILNNPLLEESGQMLEIGTLLGLGGSKPRVSVISFIGLPSLEAQQQFVNQLAMALFTWIKKNPAGPGGVSGLFVLDEAKDFLPGGSTSSPCKKSLMRLAAQARKYGLGMVLATQNPKDLDYNAVAQFATQFFGRANSPQVIDFIDEMLQAKGGSGEGVARLQKGQFFVTSSEGTIPSLQDQGSSLSLQSSRRATPDRK